jgi:hypothetical protein
MNGKCRVYRKHAKEEEEYRILVRKAGRKRQLRIF